MGERLAGSASSLLILVASLSLTTAIVGDLSTLAAEFREPSPPWLEVLASPRASVASVVALVIASAVLLVLALIRRRKSLLFAVVLPAIAGILMGVTIRLATAQVIGASIAAGWATMLFIPLALALVVITLFVIIPRAVRGADSDRVFRDKSAES